MAAAGMAWTGGQAFAEGLPDVSTSTQYTVRHTSLHRHSTPTLQAKLVLVIRAEGQHIGDVLHTIAVQIIRS